MNRVIRNTMLAVSLAVPAACAQKEANPSDQKIIIDGMVTAGFELEDFTISELSERRLQGGGFVGNVAVKGCDSVYVKFESVDGSQEWLPDIESDGKKPYGPEQFIEEFGC